MIDALKTSSASGAVDELAQNKSSLPANWLLYVLRLRQAVSHPFLLEKLKKVEIDTPYIVQIGRWCEEKLKNVMGMGYDDIHGTSLDARFDFKPHLLRLEKHQEEDHIGNVCKRCGLTPDDGFNPKACLSLHQYANNIGNGSLINRKS